MFLSVFFDVYVLKSDVCCPENTPKVPKLDIEAQNKCLLVFHPMFDIDFHPKIRYRTRKSVIAAFWGRSRSHEFGSHVLLPRKHPKSSKIGYRGLKLDIGGFGSAHSRTNHGVRVCKTSILTSPKLDIGDLQKGCPSLVQKSELFAKCCGLYSVRFYPVTQTCCITRNNRQLISK